ncbi:hypothetical protein V8E54_008833 [Elaphomyces granulatus]
MEPLQYHRLRDDMARQSLDYGYDAPDAVHDQIMRHDPSCESTGHIISTTAQLGKLRNRLTEEEEEGYIEPATIDLYIPERAQLAKILLPST